MSKTLVVYFSATGTTAKLAEKLAKAVDGDLHEILPQQPYTAADLDWTYKKSRSSVEMNDKSFRPAIVDKVEDIRAYDTLYIGFPIWWHTAPSIILTFLEQYDLTGMTIIPFATSGGSGMGDARDDMRKSCPGADVKEGRRFSGNTGEAELKSWAEGLN